MNRLILIGNGFDLAHGLKTSYNDFILWYLKKCFASAFENFNYTDCLIEISRDRYSPSRYHSVEILLSDIDLCYKNNNIKEIIENRFFRIVPNVFNYNDPFHVTIKSPLLKILLTNCSNSSWVEIETEFYRLLKVILHKDYDHITKQEELGSLNQSLAYIIEKLEFYLSQLPHPAYNPRYADIFKSSLKKFDIPLPWSEGPQWRSEDAYKINRTCILNFNFTQTAFLYQEDIPVIYNSEIIDIHGQLNDHKNPIIFGFGDELDKDYLKMEQERAKGYFDYIKSFWYFRTSNYRNLIRFVDSEEYFICVLGHSCGLSDRTMLHMIFEHQNCKSIKIFYYGNEKSNNYVDITYEIARHFNDKELMRRRIVPLDRSMRMPQYDDKT